MHNRLYKDFRLFLVAMILWGTALIWHVYPQGLISAAIVGLVLLIFSLGLCLNSSSNRSNHGQVLMNIGLYGLVLTVAALCMVISLAAHQSVDLSPQDLPEGTDSIRSLLVRVRSPVMASDRRAFDCKVDGQALVSASESQVLTVSNFSLRIYASGRDCSLRNQGDYWIQGKLSPAQYGKVPLWFSLSSQRESIHCLNPPSWWQQKISRMQDAFLEETQKLSPQGQILVPGLTLGVMGNEAFVSGSRQGTDKTLSEAYVSKVKDSFLNLGIMHLMAVSGSHFVLLASLIRWILVRCKMGNRIIAVVTTLAYFALSTMMYPSDSLIRALVMGLIGSFCFGVGLVTNAFNSLNLTVIAILLCNPSLAWSYGFALSCSAVYGILLFHRPLCRALSRYVPKLCAEPLSLTVCAQVFSLPISILMIPAVPLLSLPVNLLVSPLVSAATILGLSGFLLAPICRQLSFCLVYVASGLTQLMNSLSLALSDNSWCTIAWPAGETGVLILAFLYAGSALFYLFVKEAKQGVKAHRARVQGVKMQGENLKITLKQRLSYWIGDIKDHVFQQDW